MDRLGPKINLYGCFSNRLTKVAFFSCHFQIRCFVNRPDDCTNGFRSTTSSEPSHLWLFFSMGESVFNVSLTVLIIQTNMLHVTSRASVLVVMLMKLSVIRLLSICRVVLAHLGSKLTENLTVVD